MECICTDEENRYWKKKNGKEKESYFGTHLTVSNIIVNNTNFPNNGTTNEVGGMISVLEFGIELLEISSFFFI